MLLLTRRIAHQAVLANAARTQPRGTAPLLTITRIGRYKARIAAQTARKTSWAAPEAPSWLRRVEHWLRPPAPSGDPLQLLPWELTSPTALEVDSSDNSDLLAYAGVVVRRNAVCRDAVAACRARAEELAAEATRRATARGADAGDASAGFHFADASQRGPFRLDLRLGAALESPPFDALDLGAIWPHVRAALGEDAVLRRRGLVVGLPGASDQAYHADAPRAVWKSTSELGYPEKYWMDLREPPRHRADAVTGTTSRRWRRIATPSRRRDVLP